MTPGGQRAGQAGAPQRRHGMPALLARLMINLAVPVLVYVLLRPHVHSDITALIAGAAVPTACTASVLLWRRRLDAIGVFAIIRRADRTDIRITPGGVAGDLLMNTFGIARKIRHVLLDAPGIGS